MSADLAIRVDNLGKQYHIGPAQPRYETLHESITDKLAAPFRLRGASGCMVTIRGSRKHEGEGEGSLLFSCFPSVVFS